LIDLYFSIFVFLNVGGGIVEVVAIVVMMTSGEDFEGTFSTSPSGTLISLLAVSWINFATIRLYFQG